VSRTRILLADNHKNMRDSVLRLLEREFEVVGAVQDGRALIEADAMMKPDVCIVDISMPLIGGIEAVAELKKRGSTVKIVFMTVHEDPDFVQAAIDVGALGYVIKSRMATDLNAAIRGAMADRLFISPSCTFGCQSEHENEIKS
jgi:DNA-binding NarL/FixJ family response regulator